MTSRSFWASSSRALIVECEDCGKQMKGAQIEYTRISGSSKYHLCRPCRLKRKRRRKGLTEHDVEMLKKMGLKMGGKR